MGARLKGEQSGLKGPPRTEVGSTEDSGDKDRLGLCADCKFAERITSSKGSAFLLCGLSKIDPRFPKYPRLPVLACSGYQRNSEYAKSEQT